MIAKLLLRRIKNKIWIRRYRKANKNNLTVPINEFPLEKVNIGDYTYGGVALIDFGLVGGLEIGNFCSIAGGVLFITAADHNTRNISTFPFKSKVLGEALIEGVSKGKIVIEDDVWIGQNAIILSGVHIGQGAIIAAGAVVSSNVPPYAIIGGVPGKIIRYRFDDEIINFLMKLNYKGLNKALVSKHIEELYLRIDGFSLQELEKIFEWFPRKINSKKI